MYSNVNAMNPLVLYARLDAGSLTDESVRYPDDPYDRIWEPYNQNDWTTISTNSTVTLGEAEEPPSIVLQDAAISSSKNDTDVVIFWTSEDTNYEYYLTIHFAEIDPRAQQPKFLRVFDIFVNNDSWYEAYSPPYLTAEFIYSTSPLSKANHYTVKISASNGSVLPPLMSAVEIFSVMQLPELATNNDDVDAIIAIKVDYEIKRNWIGDPCAPKTYAWDGLSCSYRRSVIPRIIGLNLSSSGLNGEIYASLVDLKAITYLDLSNNSLTGNIPDFLADLPSLKLLNLTNNQLNGSIPSALLQKFKAGQLKLSTEGNPNLCTEGGSCEKTPTPTPRQKKKGPTLIIVIASVIGLLVVFLVVFLIWRVRKSGKRGSVLSTVVQPHNEDDARIELTRDDHLFQSENRQFSLKDLEKITRNFERDIGRGGFGTVFHGYLEKGTQVAVKMRSQSSLQGTKEFLSEAQLLTRVHHRNLVSLVGYCKDTNNLALVYEYMDQGSLHDHLRGKQSKSRVLNWGERLRIALESAQGLEYLHKGCSPPIVHRDVKTSNILLNQRFEAKLADFGLSKAFLSNEHTHISTVVGGTPGYLDPDYYTTYQLNEKSDVYSFGVVLLELITGQTAITEGSDKGHVSQWVRLRLTRGDITEVADPKLRGEYDVNSIWKLVDIAMKCTAQASIQRPMMADVVTQIKESLALEIARQGAGDLYTRGSITGGTSVGSIEIAHIGDTSIIRGPAAR